MKLFGLSWNSCPTRITFKFTLLTTWLFTKLEVRFSVNILDDIDNIHLQFQDTVKPEKQVIDHDFIPKKPAKTT